MSKSKTVTIPDFWRTKSCHFRLKPIVFFHVGKAGGGTIQMWLKHNRLNFYKSHPRPKSQLVRALQKGPLDTLIMNVRDPVDRFVSAFQWNLLITCRPDDVRETTPNSKLHARRPEKYCTDSKSKVLLLEEKYKSDPNLLAEGLCSDSPLRNEAKRDMGKINHSKQKLVHWLEFLLDPEATKKIKARGIQKFMVIPQEKASNEQDSLFESHIQNLSSAILRHTFELHLTTKIMRLRPVDMVPSEVARRENGHSSTRFAKGEKASSLTTLGECCVARHYENDYRLIRTMLFGDEREFTNSSIVRIKSLPNAHPLVQKACSWGSEVQQKLCRSDLRSMLLRRAPYLDRSLGTCSDVVVKMEGNQVW
ncbi:hypothetical protein ACHAWF_007000 [Thalassiosira exigua]